MEQYAEGPGLTLEVTPKVNIRENVKLHYIMEDLKIEEDVGTGWLKVGGVALTEGDGLSRAGESGACIVAGSTATCGVVRIASCCHGNWMRCWGKRRCVAMRKHNGEVTIVFTSTTAGVRRSRVDVRNTSGA